ncbi:MAG: A/G-specific adenine glycosylase [Paludibacteraceae bacterium]
MNNNQIPKIRQILKDWYYINKRILPWRETTDPYNIWISEIILQQTRVNQGYDYYIRFIERFPDVKSLSDTNEQEVLKYWQGLGYYSRARNLYKAACKIISDFNGRFPKTYDEILSLSGIGEYTASAISSFAYNQPYATVDGNIFRVIARLSGNETPINTSNGKKLFTGMAQELLDKQKPGLHNQTIMEFGALQCVPLSPDCENCPLQNYCEAYKLNLVNTLPVKQGKTKVSNRYFNYFYIKNDRFTYLQKRTKKDIWQNLFEFPLIETDKSVDSEELMKTESFIQFFEGCKIRIEKISNPLKHVLSHRIIYTVFYTVIIENENSFIRQLKKIPLNDLNQFPVSRLTELFLEQH